MVLLLILWFVLALAVAVLLGRMLGRASRQAARSREAARSANEVAIEPHGGPFADFRGAVLALEQRGELVAKIATLRWVGRLEPEQIAAQMQVELATVERCLSVARRTPSSRASNGDSGHTRPPGRRSMGQTAIATNADGIP